MRPRKSLGGSWEFFLPLWCVTQRLAQLKLPIRKADRRLGSNPRRCAPTAAGRCSRASSEQERQEVCNKVRGAHRFGGLLSVLWERHRRAALEMEVSGRGAKLGHFREGGRQEASADPSCGITRVGTARATRPRRHRSRGWLLPLITDQRE